jgi:hypothetical protein
LAYNPSFSACFFSRNNIFLSQQISQQCFSAGLSAQPNDSYEAVVFRFVAGLQFPLEKFVGDVLEHFELQIHQLTPNALICSFKHFRYGDEDAQLRTTCGYIC